MKEPEYKYVEEDEINLIDLLNVIWKRKWLIIIPTFILVVLAFIYSILKTPIWRVDFLITPAKFTIQTQSGQFNEVLVVSPDLIVHKINENSYNQLIAAELNLKANEFPKIRSEILGETNLMLLFTIN